MINRIILFSIRNKFIVSLFTVALIGFGIHAMTKVPLGAVPDITDNQVQVITTSPNLSTADMEQYVTYPIELAVANLPGVINIRSISRFGLSVVTIVFKEQLGAYLPRQLVGEKLNELKEEIPQKFGTPSMGPISTGLGEIYQYSLAVAPEYDSIYDKRELRTIQDWIIKRQMAMVPGVVEVNSFGGSILQYEVSFSPDRLKSMEVTIAEVFNALQRNNANTGGAYIEKAHQAVFIRGEGLVGSLDDLRSIVIKTIDGVPLLVGDVAKVNYGSAVRYGTFTKDGEGESVGGTVMMLKGANPNEVIKNVKNRMAQVQKTLPEGVKIVPFLDRSELIGRTTSTISKNLVEGALIVIFVLVLLLGNLRGGLIVASVIPLSLLFAFIMMRITGVSANLMSLGAIDFGILVDGAVIIVEGVVLQMNKQLARHSPLEITPTKMDEIAYKSGSKMMNSAFFGQLIILIVFFPILALTGVEGKMFHPMALTFSFAVLGAMILCLTYVPMMSALCLNNKRSRKYVIERWSKSIMAKIEGVYAPFIRWSLKKGNWVLLIAFFFFGLAVFTFSRMGSVFIPSLDEGDIAMQAILKPGSSLEESIKASTRIEKILLKEFPEVKHVAARIGVSEIPTDPMPMDLADMFIIMEPRKEWTSAKSREELIEKFKNALQNLPGVNFQFSQPIELRFNEILTGIREDVAIKIYGEDLDILAQKAEELAALIYPIEGIGDLQVEATRGLPQMTIKYRRESLAQYGLDIEKLNTIVSTAFAGAKAGQVFQGEKRFDLVLRMNKEDRQGLDDIRNLYIPTPQGSLIPLKEVATISYQPGPMQISRDGTHRRTYVGINVRGRDIESLVEEIQEKLDRELILPPGYYITYGGAFENLLRAKQRLAVVVPIALILIFILLYFALRSFKESVLIYMAIPLSAIGGVFSLFFRGLPFSISAGVGFIVLFGVAVLNGLVLMNSLNELETREELSLEERIYRATKNRLRPILLTATAAIMGFMPMALSTTAGAEVQRPLATVVIGGLMTATLLTLIVVPVLYYKMERRSNNRREKRRPKGFFPKASSLLLFLFLLGGLTFISKDTVAQETGSSDTLILSSIEMATSKALQNNPGIGAARLTVEKRRELQKTAFDLPATTLYYGREETKAAIPGIQSLGAEQTFEFPSVYGNKARLLKSKTQLAKARKQARKNRLTRDVSLAWYHWQNAWDRLNVYNRLDSLYRKFAETAVLNYQTGETNKLEMMATKGQQMEIALQKEQLQTNIRKYQLQLEHLLNSTIVLLPNKLAHAKAEPLLPENVNDPLDHSSLLRYNQRQIELSRSETQLEKSRLWPSIDLAYAMQRVNGQAGYHSFQIGLNIPLWFRPQQSRIQAAKMEEEIKAKQYEAKKQQLAAQLKQLKGQYRQTASFIDYYESEGLAIANEMMQNSAKAYQLGEVGYVEHLQNMKKATEMEQHYLDYLNQYNEIIIEIKYLLNQ